MSTDIIKLCQIKTFLCFLQVKAHNLLKWAADFIKKYDWVKERYSISSKILGYDLLEAQSNPSLLNLTQYSQPMIFVFSSMCN